MARKQSINDLSAIMGATEKAALKIIEKKGLVARIAERDGEVFMGTCDARQDRVNLRIKKGKVFDAYIG